MNWKIRFLPLLLAAALALGSVTAFADGEPAAPETTETTEITSEETEESWKANTYTDAQGITYQLNGNFITVTGTSTNFSGGEITIPATIEKGGISYPVTGVGDRAFYNCDALENVTFSGNADSIGDYAFYSCDALESVTFSDDVGSIRGLAFYSCDALENVTFSGNVGNIEGHAFWNCDSLENVTFSGNVGNIEGYAFWNCDSLESIIFSGDVDSIGDNAFEGCDALKTIYVPSMSNEKIAMIQAALEDSDLYNVQIEKSAPEQPSDPDPDTPPVPSTGTPSTPSTGTTSTGSAVQQLEAAERPDPMDVEATERYNFWMDVKSDLRAAGDGRTVRVYVPADYTNMPASVMETIRTLGKEITIDLRWNGQRLIITPQTALKRPARKAFWTFDALCEVYAR
jgi:hypothetical protein